jgi:hypothetical protein
MKYNLLNENTIFDNKNKIAETILLKNEALSLNNFLSSKDYNGRPIVIKQYNGSGIDITTIIYLIQPNGDQIPIADISDYNEW